MMNDTDDDAPILIRTYAELLARKNFVPRLSLKDEKLAVVKADYEFEKECHCGITSCNTAHKWGLLVGMESGKETNIGNVCGRKHFPHLYDAAHKSFHVRRERRIRADALAAYEKSFSALRAGVSALWSEERGGRWAHECYLVTHDAAPQCLLDLRSATLRIVVKKDRDTPNLGYKRTDQFEEKTVGQLAGFSAAGETPRTLLNEVSTTLNFAQGNTFTKLPAKEQRNLMNRLATAAGKIVRAHEQVQAARNFYTRANLEQLHRVGKNATAAIEAFIKRVEAVPLTWAAKVSENPSSSTAA